MIQMIKFYAYLLLIVITIKFINASCLSYGHSCWGAHGKRSSSDVQRDVKNNELNRWALFKLPEKNPMFPYNKLIKKNFVLQPRYPDNEVPINLPLYDDERERNIRNYIDAMSNEDNLKQLSRLIEPYQESTGISKQVMENVAA